MKKLLFLLLLLPTLSFGAVRDSVLIKSPIFVVMYSEVYQQPLWVQYSVLCPTGTASRAGMDFYTCDSVKTSDNADYVSNVYDKGHMAPAADFNCSKETLYQTFTYLNSALQNQYLNRGVWRILEEQERTLAKTEPVFVTIRCIFDKTSVVLPTGAKVPSSFYKTIYLPKSNKRFIYYFPNEKPTKKTYGEYEIKK